MTYLSGLDSISNVLLEVVLDSLTPLDWRMAVGHEVTITVIDFGRSMSISSVEGSHEVFLTGLDFLKQS